MPGALAGTGGTQACFSLHHGTVARRDTPRRPRCCSDFEAPAGSDRGLAGRLRLRAHRNDRVEYRSAAPIEELGNRLTRPPYMTVNQNEKAIRFRALHDGPDAFVIPAIIGTNRNLSPCLPRGDRI